MKRHYTNGMVTKVRYECDCDHWVICYANNPNRPPQCKECENMKCVGREEPSWRP